MAEMSIRGAAEVSIQNCPAIDQGLYLQTRAVAVLTLHQRLDAGRCGCGWGKIGASFIGHQVQMLAAAGLL